VRDRLRAVWRSPFCSPAGFLLRAAGLAALYGLAHLLGWRDYATVLAGGATTSELSPRTASFLGLVYVLLYLVWLIPVPILTIAAGVLWVLERTPLGRPTSGPPTTCPPSGTPPAPAS
jgi:hypothetical protein